MKLLIGALANLLLSAGAATASLPPSFDSFSIQPVDQCNTALAQIEYEARHVQNALVYREGDVVAILYGEEYSELKCNGGTLLVVRNH